MAASEDGNLIWIDLEMTGLRPDVDRILEVAAVVTDSDLDVVAEGPVLAVHQPENVLQAMDEWNRTQHASSGLTERVRASLLDEHAAEECVLAFLRQHVPAGVSPMCGNSICQDRRFLYRWMPRLEAYFHYRNLDVSTLKVLAQRWFPAVFEGVQKREAHRAIEDIRESIAELRHYRVHLLVPPAAAVAPSSAG
ncbi:MAG: oligoribonuclease [Lentisphaeria bacterium]|nr:oligoribonuclease [Lentisphaeria bacterium]